jgi:hypothetical protein
MGLGSAAWTVSEQDRRRSAQRTLPDYRAEVRLAVASSDRLGDSMVWLLRTRPRITLGATIGLVAIAALLIWSYRLYLAVVLYRALEAKHKMYYEHYAKEAPVLEAEALRLQGQVDLVSAKLDRPDPRAVAALRHMKKLVKDLQNKARFDSNLADYQLELKHKYQYAAYHPWVWVAPDAKSPPEPVPQPEPE